MKWFFGFNAESEYADNYYRYIRCAVNSAIANTSLEPHFLYDGSPSYFTKWLEGRNVTIHSVRSRFYKYFHSLNGLNAKVACGAYLRAEIPDLVYNTDPFVLYTDCDVMFINNVIHLDESKPNFFACSTETRQNDWGYFNSGVMLMNTKALHDGMSEFEKYVMSSSAEKISKGSYDQGSYNELYKGRWDRLNPIYNWKPYWGPNPDARIIHFHGLKINHIEAAIRGEKLESILQKFWDLQKQTYIELYRRSLTYETP